MARKKPARERIRQIVERWFLIEPLLLSVWTTHHLVIEPRIGTIRVRRGKIEYNPRFIDSLDKRQLEAVLRAEAVRILLKHPYHRRKENAEVAYTASNITLQEYLKSDLPLPRARDIFGTNELDQQYFEFYYHKLLEQADQAAAAKAGMGDQSGVTHSKSQAGGQERASQQEESGAESQADEGSESGATPPASASHQEQQSPLEEYADAEVSGQENTEDWDVDELLTDRINEHIRTAEESNRWGTVPGRLKERILATLKPKLDYRTVLRHFRASILSTNRVLTRMKPSRRYGFLYMGSRRDFTTRLLFAVDVSGSISSEDLARGFSIINQFFKYGISAIDVIQFDTEIKGKPLSLKRARYQMVALGRGGTNFAPVIEYIDQHRNYDGLIIFTDGYARVPPTPKNRKTRILWLFNNESNYQRMHNALRPLGRAVFLKEN